MGRRLFMCVVVSGLLAGCPSPQLGIDEVGNLTSARTVSANGVPEHYAWDIPADDLRAVLAHLEPRAPEYRRVMLSGSQSGTVQYRGEPVPVTWSRVKQGEKVYLVDVGRHRYMLREPHASAFSELLARHKRRVASSADS